MATSPARLAHAGLVVVLLASAAACGGRSAAAVDPGGAPPPARDRAGAPPPPPDPVQLYRRTGLIAHGAPMPMTGRVSYVATATPDTTFAILALALPSRALTFSHTGDRYQGGYRVEADVQQGERTTATIRAEEQVVVPNFRETTRGDEAVLFQQVLRLAPGTHRMMLRVRDQGSDRAATDTLTLDVPRLGAGGGALSTPIPYYEAVLRPSRAAVPRLLVTPRATVTFGRDSVLPVYVEGYGAGAQTVHAKVRAEVGGDVWRDTLRLRPRDDSLAVGLLELPVTELGIGAVTVSVWRPGTADTVKSPVFVSFGDDLPAGSFEDMLSYLRFFTSPQRLERLRATTQAERGRAWLQFLAETDPEPTAEGHQGLQQYFARIQVANQRYREEGMPGWLTDRGMAFVALGDPDQVYEPNPMAVGQRNRLQVWIYRAHQLQLEFRDATGFERWEMTTSAENAFQATLRRLHGG